MVKWIPGTVENTIVLWNGTGYLWQLGGIRACRLSLLLQMYPFYKALWNDVLCIIRIAIKGVRRIAIKNWWCWWTELWNYPVLVLPESNWSHLRWRWQLAMKTVSKSDLNQAFFSVKNGTKEQARTDLTRPGTGQNTPHWTWFFLYQIYS